MRRKKDRYLSQKNVTKFIPLCKSDVLLICKEIKNERFIFCFVLEASYCNQTWASADFFPGEGKIFQGGGKNILFDEKTPKKLLFSSKKCKNILFRSARGGQGPPLALPCGRPCNQRSISLTFKMQICVNRFKLPFVMTWAQLF